MKRIFNFTACLFAAGLSAQTSVVAEFKAMPAFPTTAKGAFAASKTQFFDNHYSYVDYSDAVKNFQTKVQNDIKPYTAIVTAKGTAATPAGVGAANDFSDLSSPETQAKIAKMTQEEKIKFAMEVQARMAANKNLQTVNAAAKPSPMVSVTTKIGVAYEKLVKTFATYQEGAFKGYNVCDGICGKEGVIDPVCDAKIKACENKESHAFYAAETARYAQFMKDQLALFNKQKVEFENSLKEFDVQAAKYKPDEIATDYVTVLGWIGVIGGSIGDYEKSGANIIVGAKNNVYTQKEY